MKGIEMFGEVSNTNSRGGSQYHSQGLCLGFKKLFAKLQMQTKASPKTHRLVVTSCTCIWWLSGGLSLPELSADTNNLLGRNARRRDSALVYRASLSGFD